MSGNMFLKSMRFTKTGESHVFTSYFPVYIISRSVTAIPANICNQPFVKPVVSVIPLVKNISVACFVS